MIDDLLAVTFGDPITLRYQGRNSLHPNLSVDRGHVSVVMPASLQLWRSPKLTCRYASDGAPPPCL